MIDLVYCGNKFMLDGLLLSLLSASKVCKEPLNVTILTGDFSKLKPTYIPLNETEASFLRELIQKENPESQLTLRDVTDLIQGELAQTVNLDNDYTPYCLLRSFLDLMDNIPSRVLYLDCDTIIMKDLSEFFHSDLKERDLGCVLDNVRIGFFNPSYCNAGVMLLDMDRIRHDGLMVKSRELIANKKMKHPDQDAMNKVFHKAKKITLFSRDYNEQRRLFPTTVIRHFTPQLSFFPFPHLISVKPWNIEDVHNIYHNKEFDLLFKEYISLKKDFSIKNAGSFK